MLRVPPSRGAPLTHLTPATAGGSLRERFIADMTVRGFTDKTRNDYIRTVAGCAAFLGALAEHSHRRGHPAVAVAMPWPG